MEAEKFDIVVVGGRCAGSTTAMLAAQAGYRVLLLERSLFPTDKLSTLYIQPPGVAKLSQWGLLEQVLTTGCPPLENITYRLGEVSLSGTVGGIGDIKYAVAPRRYLLDDILADAAATAGVDVRYEAKVIGVLTDDDRVTGVRYQDGESGRERQVQCQLVVGADGMRSTVAQLVNAPKTIEHNRLTCAYYGFWEGIEAHFELFEGESGWVSAVPTSDAVLVAAYFPQEAFTIVRQNVEASFLDNVRDNAPQLWERMSSAKQVDKFYGTGDQQNFFRQASGNGWVLVGDAGHHKDSLTARGIGDAFTQAELVIQMLDGSDLDPKDVDERMKQFGEQRDLTLMESYQGTLLVAEASARQKRQVLLQAVGTSPTLTRQYFDTVAGISPISSLYGPELQAAMESVQQNNP